MNADYARLQIRLLSRQVYFRSLLRDEGREWEHQNIGRVFDRKRAPDELEQIARALTRLETGTFGICMNKNCGLSIEPERLNDVPTTTLCSKCQQALVAEKAKALPLRGRHYQRREYHVTTR